MEKGLLSCVAKLLQKLLGQTKIKQINKKDRQSELKQVLFETIKLTNTLKHQLKKLEMSGLSYSHFPNNSYFK